MFRRRRPVAAALGLPVTLTHSTQDNANVVQLRLNNGRVRLYETQNVDSFLFTIGQRMSELFATVPFSDTFSVQGMMEEKRQIAVDAGIAEYSLTKVRRDGHVTCSCTAVHSLVGHTLISRDSAGASVCDQAGGGRHCGGRRARQLQVPHRARSCVRRRAAPG